MRKRQTEKELAAQSETFGGVRAGSVEQDIEGETFAGESGSKKKSPAFLKMFRFDKARTPASMGKEVNEL